LCGVNITISNLSFSQRCC